MNTYNEIIDTLENIIANDLNVKSDYEIICILNDTIDNIKSILSKN